MNCFFFRLCSVIYHLLHIYDIESDLLITLSADDKLLLFHNVVIMYKTVYISTMKCVPYEWLSEHFSVAIFCYLYMHGELPLPHPFLCRTNSNKKKRRCTSPFRMYTFLFVSRNTDLDLLQRFRMDKRCSYRCHS